MVTNGVPISAEQHNGGLEGGVLCLFRQRLMSGFTARDMRHHHHFRLEVAAKPLFRRIYFKNTLFLSNRVFSVADSDSEVHGNALPRRTCPSGVFLFWVRHGVVNSDTYDKQVPRWPWWGFPSSSFRASSSFKNIFK